MREAIKLNLGCGGNLLPGYVNVDKVGEPDLRHDLEVFPWPFDDDSVGEVVLNHVLEHLGQTTDTYLGIMRELYRVCRGGARIRIHVPHPRHDDFINDPTHVRAVTPDSLLLFSQRKNLEWVRRRCANSTLGLSLGVDFELADFKLELDPAWGERLQKGEIDQNVLFDAVRRYNNVVKEFRMELRVVKPPTSQTDPGSNPVPGP
ncbi:MAG: hypothetical protein Q9Q40_09760 [Acidobacteriota bacterium]|nr:hypothetical protein [Acidobacteriota bacterium]